MLGAGISVYYSYNRSMERVRWSLADDVAWDRFDAAALTDEQLKLIANYFAAQKPAP